jgi:ribonuclease HII
MSQNLSLDAALTDSGVEIPGLNDSKQLKEYEREALYEVITNTPGVLWAV